MKIKKTRYLILAAAIIIGMPLIFIFPNNHYLWIILLTIYLLIGLIIDFFTNQKWQSDEMKKMTSEQKSVINKATRNGYFFYMVALLIWAIYNQFTKGNPGLPLTLLIFGGLVFSGSKYYYNEKDKSES